MATATKLRDLVVIENGTLAALATNAKAVKAFPFLAAAKAKPGGCGGCRRRRQAAAADAYGTAKRTIAGLGSEQKRILLGLLGARQARVTYVPVGGKAGVTVTFGTPPK